jgi:LacI family transcriptional regulator
MTVTIKHVAKLAGCSIKTVSRVVNGEAHVAEVTREKVQAAIDALGYTPNITARRLVQRKSFMIGILMHAAGHYQSEVLSRVMDMAYQLDYDILLQTYYPSHERSREKLRALINEKRVDGLVTTPPCDVDPLLSDLLFNADTPYVQISPLNRDPKVPYVTGDDYQGAYLMTERLIMIGHWRIAFLAGPRNHRMSIDRLFGYKAALETYRIPIQDELILDSLYNFDGGYNATRVAMALDERPTAIFGGSDEAAMGALFALREMGMAVPQQVSVCGFDNLPHSSRVWPGLSTVNHPIDQIVGKAVEMLLTLLAGNDLPVRQVVYPSQLEMRGSVGAPPVAQ